MSYNLKDLICRGNITLEVADDLVLYKAELMSSIGNIFRNEDKSTEITMVVYKGLDDVTNKFSDIEWKRFTFKSNGEEDKTWGEKHKGKRQITVTKDEIEGKAVIQCGVYQMMNGERKLIAAQSITFIDVNDITPSTKPPNNPIDGEIWIDSSVDPPVIKVWDEEKGQWITVTQAGSSTKNLINNSSFWKSYGFTDYKLVGTLHDYRIAPYQGKNYAQIRADFYEDEIRGFYQDIKKSYFPGETYLIQAKAYILDQSGMYDGGITLSVMDVTTKQGPNLEEIEVETELVSKTFSLKSDKVQTVHTVFTMPNKITKLRVYVYGEKERAFHIAVTELSLSHNAHLHDWELSDEDIQYKIDHKVENDPNSVFNALTDGGKMQGIYTAINPDTGKDDYYINANYIKSGQVEAEYINAKGLTVSRDIIQEDGTNKKINTLEVTKDGDVHILAEKFSLMPMAETNVPTKDEMNDELNTKVNADKESIIGAINDTGIFLENGKLTINADNVSTGILKSRNDVSKFDLNAGTFILGKSDTNFKMKFDGTDLLFGNGAIKWENLDNTVTEELMPYDVYLEKSSIIVTDEINGQVQPEVGALDGEIVIPDNKPTNRVLATKGNNKLIASENNPPNEGEFYFRILEQYGCEIIKYAPDAFYINKVNVKNAYAKVSVSCEDKQILTRTMTINKTNLDEITGPQGETGLPGDMATFIYCKSKTKPAKPKGQEPKGWYERIEDIIEQGDLWCSQGIKAADTGLLKGEWQEPYKLEDANNNLLANYNWTPGTGSCGIYTALGGETENIRTTDKDPKGNQSLIWTAISQDANGVMEFIDGGFTASVKIDYMKTYRFSVWAKVSDKNCYINMSADLANTNNLNGDVQPNPEFYSAPLPEKDKWFLIVGYVLGTGAPHVPSNSGVYDSANGDRILIEGKEYSLPTFRNKDGAEKQTIKVFMSGGETVGVNAKFFDPRIEIVDGEEESLDSMLGKLSNMKWIYEWNGTRTEINGSAVLTPKIFTGTIEPTSGKHTGIAMGMNVLGDGQNGIVGYSKGDKTFHIKTDGSAVFGKEEKDHIEISSDGIATLPVVKGDRIQANKLVVKLLDGKGNVVLDKQGKEINTLEITDRGEVIMHPSKFEMLSTITNPDQGGGEDNGASALVPQLESLGMKFQEGNPPQFYINATQITTGQLKADRLDLYGLVVKNRFDDRTTLEITQSGEVNLNANNITVDANSFTLTTGGGSGQNFNSAVTSIATSPGVINMVADNINLTGYVKFSQLSSSGSTTINGDNITTGTIRCNRIGAASKWSDAILKLFDHNGGACAIDATKDMNYGQGTAIRFKWDDSNYVFVSDGAIKNYIGTYSNLSVYSTGIHVVGNLDFGSPERKLAGNFGKAKEYAYANEMYAMQYYHKKYDKEFTTSLYSVTQENNVYSFFKNYKNNIKILKEDASLKSVDSLESDLASYSKEINLLKAIEGDPDGFMTNVGFETELQSECLETLITKLENLQQNYDLLSKQYNTLQTKLIKVLGGDI